MGLREERLVESVLFSASKPVGIEEIKEASGLSKKKVTEALENLIQTYNVERKKETSIEVIKAGDKYTMQVKKKFFDQSVMVAKPEIQSRHLKTLALIAFHQPVKQSNLRRMVGPKVYDHVDELFAMKRFDDRRTIVPFHLYAPLVMGEIIQVQLERVTFRMDHFSDYVDKFRLAIGCQPHHLVLIPVIGKPEIHRQRCVEEPN